jgi:hypothetical protein
MRWFIGLAAFQVSGAVLVKLYTNEFPFDSVMVFINAMSWATVLV